MVNPSNAYLTLLLSWIRAAVSVNVFPNSTVRGLPSGHRNRHITEWAYRYLDILQSGSRGRSVAYSQTSQISGPERTWT